MDQVHNSVLAVFRDVFDDDDMDIFPEMTAADVEEWDSLMQIRLILGTERAFGIKFTTGELENIRTVGDFLQIVRSKI